MKKLIAALFICALSAAAIPAKAQYYEIANQLPQLIRPALSGSFNYKGFVEGSYLAGVGGRRASTIDISTTQGFQYASWFFMGVGAGVDIMTTSTSDNWGDGWTSNGWQRHSDTKTGVLIPLYTDFRFNIGSGAGNSVSVYIDARIGAAFLLGNDYLRIGDGYITRNECFYLRPSIGVRIPVSSSNPKQAFNIGASYQLLTQNYWYGYNSDIALSSVGATISYEW